jgi:hypothetical protein
MLKIVLVVCALAAVASARLRACDKGVLGPNPRAVRITGCSNPNTVCRIIRGRDIVGQFDFVASKFNRQIEEETR